ncbi:hypothetical protein TNCV_1910201 [Trichonephila clavipes]|nr:hypothetical protein TNCV_1910201 [Trichonephila clavipes]
MRIKSSEAERMTWKLGEWCTISCVSRPFAVMVTVDGFSSLRGATRTLLATDRVTWNHSRMTRRAQISSR